MRLFMLVVTTSKRAIAEAYQAERQKKHIERVFKRDVEINFTEEGWKLSMTTNLEVDNDFEQQFQSQQRY